MECFLQAYYVLFNNIQHERSIFFQLILKFDIILYLANSVKPPLSLEESLTVTYCVPILYVHMNQSRINAHLHLPLETEMY